MRKLPFYFCLLVLAFFLFATPVSAQNKIGINLGGRWNVPGFKQAAQIVGEGGWISLMAYPSGLSPDCGTSLQAVFDIYNPDSAEFYDPSVPRVNIVIRRYNSGRYFTPEDGREFAEMYRKLNTYGQTIYDMPWNEPGHLGSESIGLSNIDQVAQAMAAYLNASQAALGPLLGSKVIMIAPMFDQHYRGCGGQLCGKEIFEKTRAAGFDLNQFEFVPINLYIRYINGQPVEGDTNVTKFGFSGGKKVIGLELGVIDAYKPIPPVYPPDYPPGVTWGGFLSYVFGSFDFIGVTPFAYDPHRPEVGMYIFKPEYASELQKYRGSGSVPMNASPQDEKLVAIRGDDECLGVIIYGPIGYLDQMNITFEKEIDPCQGLEPEYWARCYNPDNQTWNMTCVQALNKMGFAEEGRLYYPYWLKQWRDYILQVLPRFTEYEKIDDVVKHAEDLANSPAQGWVEFVTSGENHDTKMTQITHPRAMLFDAQFVRQLSFATDFIWKNLTSLFNQPKRPILTRDSREDPLVNPELKPGFESPNNDEAHFNPFEPAPGLFAVDKFEGSCSRNNKKCDWDCLSDAACQKKCCKERDPITGICLKSRDEEDEVWTMRQINPQIETHDNIETLNPGWQELANTWSNVANPINGFIPAIAASHNLPVKREGVCDDLFGKPEDLEKPKPNLCSWRYADVPFTYNYGPWAVGKIEGEMKPHGCAQVINPEDADESKTERQCLAHWPFVGGLHQVYNFIADWTNVYKRYHLEP